MVEKTSMAINQKPHDIKDLQRLAARFLASEEFELNLLKGDGSERKIYRIVSHKTQNESVIGVILDNPQENRDFFLITDRLAKAGIPVPEIHAINREQTAYLLQDLGPYNLAECIDRWKQENQSEKIMLSYRTVIRYLVKIQNEMSSQLGDFLKNRQMGTTIYQDDLNFFRKNFLERFGFAGYLDSSVENELQSVLIDRLVRLESHYFVYRDFQARNVMWMNDSPWFIDYQSALKGSLLYDPASLLYASRAGLDDASRDLLLRYYFDFSGNFKDWVEFRRNFFSFVLVRRLRSLGTYGYLSQEKGKIYFFESIRPTLLELTNLFSRQEFQREFVWLPEMIKKILERWHEQEKPTLL